MSHFVLAVERDRHLLNHFRRALAGDNFEVITAMSRGDAMARASAWSPSAAVVGPGFGEDRLDIVRDLRRQFGLRTLVAVGARESALVAAALELGAVGYVQLPVGREEFAERVREMVVSRAVTDGHYVTAGPLTLDLERHALVRPRPGSALTPCEFEILRWLVTPPGRTFTRRQLLAADRAAFPPQAGEEDVERHMRSLRRKLGEAGAVLERAEEIGWRINLRRATPAEIEFPLTNVTYEV